MKVFFGVLLAVSALACGITDPDPTVRPPTRVDPNWVAGAAAAQLQANGRFDLTSLAVPEPGDLDESAARSLAIAFVRSLSTAIGNLAAVVQQDHGAPLEFASLIICPRTLLQRSPWIPGAGTGPLYLSNAMGNRYWFTFCTQSGVVALFQQVAARSTVTVLADGRLSSPNGTGNDFAAYGIPLDGRWELSPEVAVAALLSVMTRKVVAIGAFTGCPFSIPPCVGVDGYLWHLSIDRPIRVRRVTDMIEQDVTDFYVEASRTSATPLRILIPEALQPADQWISGPTPHGLDSLWLTRRSPVRFADIVITGH